MYKKSFTLVEVLVVIGIIAIVAVVVIAVFNPMAQIGKSFDARRKSDLELLQKAYENYYNDKGCYPKPEEVCYDYANLINICQGGGSWENVSVNSQVCHICGTESDPPSFSVFSPYLSKLPCDPEFSKKIYLYEVQANSAIRCNKTSSEAQNSCPQWYGIFSQFSYKQDQQSINLNCTQGGCGIGYDSELNGGRPVRPSGILSPFPQGFDYGITSPNRKVQSTDSYACVDINDDCNYCGLTYDECAHPENHGRPRNNGCLKIFSSRSACCAAYPIKYPDGCY